MVSVDTKRQNPLEAVVVRSGITGAARRLGVSYAYIHQVYNGKMPLTDKLRKRIAALHPRERHHLSVDFENEDDLRLAQKLNMETRKKVLLDAAKGEL